MGRTSPPDVWGQSVAAILLVSADPSLDGAYPQALNAGGYTVARAPDSAQAVRALLTLRVQAIVLDSRIGSGSEDLQRWLRADRERAAVPVLYLMPPAADLQIAPPAGFRPGVDSVLCRPFAPSDLAEALGALLTAPGREVAVERVGAGPFSLDLRRRVLSAGERSVAVTPIECRLLRCLMERPGMPVGFEELLTRVWGYYPGTGGPEVVRAHVRNVRRKLQQVAAGSDVLLTIPRVGYRFAAGKGEASL